MEKEKFGSRLGFILISAGCAIGLGNVWKFPIMVGQYGGAAFILIYLLFLLIFGLPIMTMEFSVGRASGLSVAKSFAQLEPKGTKWNKFGWVAVVGNYLLMMFYTLVAGWMFVYFFKYITGAFEGMDNTMIPDAFGQMTADPLVSVGCMVLVVVLGFGICALGFKKGVERVNKVMMLALLVIIIALAVYVCTLPGADEGLAYYFVPDFQKMADIGIGKVVFGAMSQAFFTLSIGMGSMAIFGSHIGKDRSLFGESICIAGLDTFVAIMAGLIVIPACFAFGTNPGDGGPGLLFMTLPQVFNSMPAGNIIGTLFFVFMVFAAMSTVVAVFENIISFGEELFGWSRKKSCLINLVALIVLSIPCALSSNLLSSINIAGMDIMGIEDFLVSSNILPLGSLVYVLFCTSNKYGWGWDNFIKEANTGNGVKLPRFFRGYCSYVLPVVLLVLWLLGILNTFGVITL